MLFITVLNGLMSESVRPLSICEKNPVKLTQNQVETTELVATGFVQNYFKSVATGLHTFYSGEYKLIYNFRNYENVNLTAVKVCGDNDCEAIPELPTIEELQNGIDVNVTDIMTSGGLNHILLEFDVFNTTAFDELGIYRAELCDLDAHDLDHCSGFRVCDEELKKFDQSNLVCAEYFIQNLDGSATFEVELQDDGSPIMIDPQLVRFFMEFKDGTFSKEEMEVSASTFVGMDVIDDKQQQYFPTLDELSLGMRIASENATSLLFRFGIQNEQRNVTFTKIMICLEFVCHGFSQEACNPKESSTLATSSIRTSQSISSTQDGVSSSSLAFTQSSQSITWTSKSWTSMSYSSNVEKTSKTWTHAEAMATDDESHHEQNDDGNQIPPAGTNMVSMVFYYSFRAILPVLHLQRHL
eukprot:NODE_492_length_6837_cov_0.395963.p1 type:complete len:412 gc:universal NODE_492_length_6837_cov_0.395963:6030-4795(-)